MYATHCAGGTDLPREAALELLIDASIIARYDGDLEKLGPDQDGADNYIPLDPDHIRTLLLELRGARVTAETIEDAFTRLIEDGADNWPRAYCEEDDETYFRLSDLGPD